MHVVVVVQMPWELRYWNDAHGGRVVVLVLVVVEVDVEVDVEVVVVLVVVVTTTAWAEISARSELGKFVRAACSYRRAPKIMPVNGDWGLPLDCTDWPTNSMHVAEGEPQSATGVLMVA